MILVEKDGRGLAQLKVKNLKNKRTNLRILNYKAQIYQFKIILSIYNNILIYIIYFSLL